MTRWPLQNLGQRFWKKVRVIPCGGCWEWTASLNDSGYGQINVGGRPARAHRVAYEFVVGPIPDGLVIDHLCRNRTCVNPSHMEVVTRGENVRRGVGPARAAAKRLNRVACKRGHVFDEGNTAINSRGARVCRTCRREAARDRRAA